MKRYRYPNAILKIAASLVCSVLQMAFTIWIIYEVATEGGLPNKQGDRIGVVGSVIFGLGSALVCVVWVMAFGQAALAYVELSGSGITSKNWAGVTKTLTLASVTQYGKEYFGFIHYYRISGGDREVRILTTLVGYKEFVASFEDKMRVHASS